jgi:transcriptional regulator with XRE-family HTH domain
VIDRTSINSRHLGGILRAARERQNLSSRHLSELLGWSESKISRVLTGRLILNNEELSAVLALCHITGHDRAAAIALNTDKPTHYSHVEHESILFENLADAARSIEYGGLAVPPLLQTDTYAKSILGISPGVPASDIDEILRIRNLSSQRLVGGEKQVCGDFFFSEHSFYQPFGYEVMEAQCLLLYRMTHCRNITIRAMPATGIPHPGLLGGPWTYLALNDFPDAVRIYEECGARFVEDPEQVRQYLKSMDRCDQIALEPRQTREAIREALKSEYQVKDKVIDEHASRPIESLRRQ